MMQFSSPRSLAAGERSVPVAPPHSGRIVASSETNLRRQAEFRLAYGEISRSRYVPVRRNFAVFCVFGVS